MEKLKEFLIFKTEECNEPLCTCYRGNHDDELPEDYAECPYYHNNSDKRRAPFLDVSNRKLSYQPTYPEEMNPDPEGCQNVVEYLYHPSIFKTKLCRKCPGYFCPYFHQNTEEKEKWDKILRNYTSSKATGTTERTTGPEMNISSMSMKEHSTGNILGQEGISTDSKPAAAGSVVTSSRYTSFELAPPMGQQMNKEKKVVGELREEIKEPEGGSLYEKIAMAYSKGAGKDMSMSQSGKSNQGEVHSLVNSSFSSQLGKPGNVLTEEVKEQDAPKSLHTSVSSRLGMTQEELARALAEKYGTLDDEPVEESGIKTSVLREEPARERVEQQKSVYGGTQQARNTMNVLEPLGNVTFGRAIGASGLEILSTEAPQRNIAGGKVLTVLEVEAGMRRVNVRSGPFPRNDIPFQYGSRIYYYREIVRVKEFTENDVLCFKTTPHHNRLIEEDVCAMLNSRGGTIYFGIDENGSVEGVRLQRKMLDELSITFDRKLKTFNPPIRADQYEIKACYVFGDDGFAPMRDRYVVEIEIVKGDPGELYYNDQGLCFAMREGRVYEMYTEEIMKELKRRTVETTKRNIAELIVNEGFNDGLREIQEKGGDQALLKVKAIIEQKIKLTEKLMRKGQGEMDNFFDKLGKLN